MGNDMNTPGLIKFWWKNQIVETPYETIHQIPLMNIHKQETTIVPSSEPFAILHYDDARKCSEVLGELKAMPKLRVYAVPSQNSKQSFDMIRANNNQSLGKMTMNGPRSHPLFKYLKKNCDKFYSYKTNTAKKNIDQPLGLFLVQNSTEPNNTRVKYYKQNQIKNLIQAKDQAQVPLIK